MTTIIIGKSKANSYRQLICSGHAGYPGKKCLFKKTDSFDLVCASASVLIINTINALEELAEEDFKCISNEEDGFIRCDFENPLQERSVFLLDAMVFGLQNIQKEYGEKYLQVKFEEV